jgi:hypothetical protein
MPSHCRLAEPPPGDPEAGEQARSDQPEDPRIARFHGGQEGLHAARADLARDVRDRGDEDEERARGQPDHRGERAVAPRDGRP